MRASAPLISVLVPTRNQHALLERLLASLARTLGGHRAELLIIDNGSDEADTRAFLRALPARPEAAAFESVRVLRDPAPFNYSRLNNLAAAHARGEMLCLLNDDIEAIGDADWLGALLAHAAEPDAGCIGAKLLYPDSSVQHAGVMLGPGGVAGHPFKGVAHDDPGPGGWLRAPRQVSAVTGACLLVRHAVFDEVNGFDERLAVAWNDVDLCLRVAAAGYRNVWTPEAVLRHHESISRGVRGRRSRAARRRHALEVRYMRARWGTRLDRDPYLPDCVARAADDAANARGALDARRIGGHAIRTRLTGMLTRS